MNTQCFIMIGMKLTYKYPNSNSMKGKDSYYELSPLDRHYIQYVLWFNGIKKSRADTVKTIINNLKPIINKIDKQVDDKDKNLIFNYGYDYASDLSSEERKVYNNLEKKFKKILEIFSDYTNIPLMETERYFESITDYMNEEGFNQEIHYYDMVREVERRIVQLYIDYIQPKVNLNFSKVTPENINSLY